MNTPTSYSHTTSSPSVSVANTEAASPQNTLSKADALAAEIGTFSLSNVVSAVIPALAPAPAPFTPSAGEIGFAERFADQWGEITRFDYTRGLWMTWRDTHWSADDRGEVVERMKSVAANILQVEVPVMRAASVEPGDYYESMARSLVKDAHKLHNRSTILASLGLAQSMHTLVTSASQYDADPLLFNCLSGTVDLRDGRVRKHNPLDYMTQMGRTPLGAEGEDCPRWKQFLLEIMRGDAEMVDYLQRVLGYILTGDTSEQCFFMLYGMGANGKSTFINVVQHILGDYAKTAEFNTFLDLNRGAAPRNDLAVLTGKRFVVASEGSEGKSLDEAVIKQFCGGDNVSARLLHKELFEFRPVCKIMLATNHKPIVRGTDEGIWRRMRLVPFLANFTEAQRDPGLEHKLKAEAPAILRWMVQGCQLWLSQGLSMPQAVKEATSEYRSSMDVFQTFLEERCSTDAASSVNSQELYDTYTAWCADNGIRLPLRQSLFNQRLEERGYRRKKSNGRNMWAGLRLGQKRLTAKSDDTPSLSCDYQQGDISFSE